jgi:hypothetical protein
MSELVAQMCKKLPNGLLDDLHQGLQQATFHTRILLYDAIHHPSLPDRFLKEGFVWDISDPVDKIGIISNHSADGDHELIHDSVALDKYLDTTFLKGYEYTRIQIIVPIGRNFHSVRKEIVEISIPCTPRAILEAVSSVYQRPSTAEFVETLREFDGRHSEASEDVLRMLDNNKAAKYHHLQGDMTHYGGLDKIGSKITSNVYKLELLL